MSNIRKRALYLIPILFFVGFVLYLSYLTYDGKVLSFFSSTRMNADSLERLTDGLEKSLRENFAHKYDFINLAGAAASVSGLNTFNHVQKLGNGFLGPDDKPKWNVPQLAERIIALDNFLKERDINFLLVLAPDKFSLQDAKFLPGYDQGVRLPYEDLATLLGRKGVSVISMPKVFKEGSWRMEELFFKTDHHWKPKAALEAARKTMEVLEKKGWSKYHKDLLKDENYDITKLRKAFLGSWGRRTGIYYAGIDDIDLYVPKFQTDYRHYGLKQQSTEWFHRNTLLDRGLADNKDYFNKETYSMYLSEDLPLRIVENSTAPNPQRVVVTGDSFHKPWLYFLASQFGEIHGLDLRLFSDGTFAQYVEQLHPSIVIMTIGGRNLRDKKAISFGTEVFAQAQKEGNKDNAEKISEIVSEAGKGDARHFEVLNFGLRPGKTYTLTVDSTSLTGSKEELIQMTLQNLTVNRPVLNRYFWANSSERQTWIFTVPDSPQDAFALYVYAGTKGNTKGAKATVRGITMLQGVPPRQKSPQVQ